MLSSVSQGRGYDASVGEEASRLFGELSRPIDRADILRGFKDFTERMTSPAFRRSMGAKF